MKLIWCSDIHLNFLTEKARMSFYEKLKEAEGEVILITGDIAESHNVVQFIKEMEIAARKPVCFVLGNHDFYGSSVKEVKKSVSKLNWLPNAPLELDRNTILSGVDGWGDCRYGDFEGSRISMSDWTYIEELRIFRGSKANLKKTIQKLADSDARNLKRNILKVIDKGYKKIIIATHVPPFEEACLNAGRKSTSDGLPFFASKCLGNAVLPIAKKNKEVTFTWLCGHTHNRVTYAPLPNLTVRVAGAEYFNPQIEAIIN